jgi:NADH dehydrogenase (ubiquinone) 1 beta subcomplex subunit 3
MKNLNNLQNWENICKPMVGYFRSYSKIQHKPKGLESAEDEQKGGFWPPGPPSFHREPEIVEKANHLYTNVLRQYKTLGHKSRQEWADPWAKREDWRYHPYFSGPNVLKNAFPGLSWALLAFGAYCGYEHLTNPTKSASH